MRILIGTLEKSNMLTLYKMAFESLGHKVVTVAVPHPFYKADYTHNNSIHDSIYVNNYTLKLCTLYLTHKKPNI